MVFFGETSRVALEQIGVPRIHFAFLDAEHTYDAVRRELAFVAAHQQEGDVIVCDDYTPSEFPEIVRAVDELAATGAYALEPVRELGRPRIRVPGAQGSGFSQTPIYASGMTISASFAGLISPNARIARPSGPASNDRRTGPFTRTASHSPTSCASPSRWTFPLPSTTT